MPNGQRNQPKSRIGDSRHARIRHQGDARPLLQLFHQLGRTRHLVVFVVADGAGRDAVVVKQLLGLPGVFAGDYIHLLEYTYGPQRDVLQISDWRGDEIKSWTRGVGGTLRGGGRRGRSMAGIPHEAESITATTV